VLDVVQELAAIGNRLAVERDWVPVLVGPITMEMGYSLTQVNAVMRRIDFVCKLIAPSLLPFVVAALKSRTAWLCLLAGMTVMLWGVEVATAVVIVKESSELKKVKEVVDGDALEQPDERMKSGWRRWPREVYSCAINNPVVRLKHYFSTEVWPASMSVALIQLTVLAYSATMITYLLEVGFSLTTVTIARGSGALAALGSTFITPLAVDYMRRMQTRQTANDRGKLRDDELEGAVIRSVGLWGIGSQFLSLIAVVIVLWNLSPLPEATTRDDSSKYSHPITISIILFSFLSLSRVGHWMFDLMVQELEQVEIPVSQRSTFAGTEQSFRSLSELCHWAATVGWSKPEQFRWLASGSLIVLGVSTVTFAIWTRSYRVRKGRVMYEEIGMAVVDSRRDSIGYHG